MDPIVLGVLGLIIYVFIKAIGGTSSSRSTYRVQEQTTTYGTRNNPSSSGLFEHIRIAHKEVKHRNYYRTSDGAADYLFSFEEQSDGTWRVYIEQQPSYRGRPTDGESTHRLPDGDRKYICWTRPLYSLEEAKQVASLWADKTQEYIRTGKKF